MRKKILIIIRSITRFCRAKRGIVLILIVLIVLGVGGFFIYKKIHLQKEKPEEKPEMAEVKPEKEITFVDTHAHFFSGGNAAKNADEFVKKMDAANVSKAVLFGGCDQPYFDKKMYKNGTRLEADARVRKAYEKYPDRFYPVLSGFDPQNENSVDYLEQEFKTGIWKGLGEIYLIQFSMLHYKTRADHPNMMRIYRVLAKYNATIFLHYERRTKEDVEAIYRALEQNPDVNFVWVHFANTGPNEIQGELEKYPNLYISFEGSWSQDSQYPQDFLNLLEEYPDRFMIGTDVGCAENFLTPTPTPPPTLPSPTTPYESAIAKHNELLSKLSPETAKKIAYKNVEKLMNPR